MMVLGDLLQGLTLLILGWIGTELRSIRGVLAKHGERVAALEARIDERGHHQHVPNASSSTLLLLVLVASTLACCAATGGAVAGGMTGGAIAGGPGALAGAIGGLLGAFWTQIVQTVQQWFGWMDGNQPADQAGSNGEPWRFLYWLMAAASFWLLVHVITPAGMRKMLGLPIRAARSIRGLLRLRPQP